MGLPAHTVSRRGRAFEVSASGQLVGMWTDASAAAGGVYLWRPGSDWSREMIAVAAQAAAVAGIAESVVVRRRAAGRPPSASGRCRNGWRAAGAEYSFMVW